MSDFLIPCPRCAEKVKYEALICRYCGHEFSDSERAERQSKKTAQNSKAGVGCLAFVAVIALPVAFCDHKPSPEQIAKKEEDRRKGFHCLSSLDGSHAGVVKALKKTLREPASFEHIETRVTPKSSQGTHYLIMKYRARNGYGGYSMEAVETIFSQETCEPDMLIPVKSP